MKPSIGSVSSSASTRGTTSTVDRIEAEGAHGVDLLAHLHRADLRR